jgi:hypothetical protein
MRHLMMVGVVIALIVVLPGLAFGDVDNGGFESPAVTNGAGWDIFDGDAVGWDVEWAGTYAGAPEDALLEIHAGVNGWLPYEGDQYAELDSDWQGPGGPSGEQASVRISQDVPTLAGWVYELAYAWSPRPNHGDNALNVTVDGTTVGTHSASGGSNTVWTPETVEFTGAAGETTTEVAFAEAGTPDSLGMFLDDVSVALCTTDPSTVNLIAGQTIDAGDVTVWHDDEYVYVDFVAHPNWLIAKTHVHVAASADEIPQTKKGNPIPGQFDYQTSYMPWEADPAPIMIPLPDMPGEIFVAAHADLYEISEMGDYWAMAYASPAQGRLNNGDPITDPARIDPAAVLGADDFPPAGFFSLGFGGSIEVTFGAPVFNGAGDDVFVYEATNGRSGYPLETAMVKALYDGMWYDLGTVTSKSNGTGVGSVDLGTLPYAEAIKIVDTTDGGIHVGSADGYDLDAVRAASLVTASETGWGEGMDFPGNNWGMYFTYTLNVCD